MVYAGSRSTGVPFYPRRRLFASALDRTAAFPGILSPFPCQQPVSAGLRRPLPSALSLWQPQPKPVNRMSLPNSKKLPGGEYTVAFISQLAADKEFQGSGIGEKLLLFAQFQALRVSAVFGLVGVALDLLHVEDENPAITQKRRLFYTNRQLEPLIDDAQRFYKSMDAIRRMNFNL